MFSKSRPRRRVALLVAGIGAALVASAVAVAHGGDASKIHACVVKDTRYLRLVMPDDTCKSNETAIDWNIQGPQGLQGVQGVQGAQGPQGDPGTPGISGWDVQEARGYAAGNSVGSAYAACHEGQKVLGGGFLFDDNALQLLQSGPWGDDQWRVTAYALTSNYNPGFMVYAICADVGP
jgi:hypothetical protein